jgi:hypothetical protein
MSYTPKWYTPNEYNINFVVPPQMLKYRCVLLPCIGAPLIRLSWVKNTSSFGKEQWQGVAKI